MLKLAERPTAGKAGAEPNGKPTRKLEGEPASWAYETLARAMVEQPILPPAPQPVRPLPTGPAHAPDFSCVRWFGRLYALTPKQRVVVAELWRAWENGTPFVSGAYLIEQAETDQGRLSQLFRGSPAWGTLVVPGTVCLGPAGTFCLAPAPPAE